MKDLKLFSIEEMSVLEALNVKGGIAELAVIQNGCSNNVAGCACDIVIVSPKPTVPTVPTRPNLLRIQNASLANIYQYVWVYVHAIMEAHHIVNSMEWT